MLRACAGRPFGGPQSLALRGGAVTYLAPALRGGAVTYLAPALRGGAVTYLAPALRGGASAKR